jgi:hypothetical protein
VAAAALGWDFFFDAAGATAGAAAAEATDEEAAGASKTSDQKRWHDKEYDQSLSLATMNKQ